MKVRVKFAKEGVMKFIGHLDIMRYFQKAIKRAGIDVAYSEGFSPHMIMSFAAPLGVGVTSTAEYFDMEINMPISGKEAVKRLNEVMVEGMEVKSFRKIPDGKANAAMALVAAADYYVEFREGMEPETDWKNKIEDFVRQSEILIVKKTKKNEKEVDIRPYIYEMRLDGEGIFMQLASASSNYTKPELVMDTFLRWMGEEPLPFAYMIERREIYANKGDEEHLKLVSMEALGEKVE